MHAELEFTVEPRTGTGKGMARKLRAGGKTPGIVYGFGMDPVMVAFREPDLVKALSTPAQRNAFLRLQCDDERVSGARVMVKELQVHPVRRVFIHADFYRLNPNRVFQIEVPIRLDGTAAGVKLGGIMQVARREIVVACLPDELPDAIPVDVTDMQVGDSIHVGDLQAPPGVRIVTNPILAVCAVIAPSAIEEPEEEEEELAEEEVGEEAEAEAEEETSEE
jgi:large subunit ribosomal protein L25